MKLILSRKGFDSASGGGPSPILPDGRMVSLPIPEDGPAGIPYDELQLETGGSYADLMRELHVRMPSAGRGHLDPDLRMDVRARPPGWRPLFGQCGAAQRHLALQGVGPGDLFLFFGLFRPCILTSDGVAWDRGQRPCHALWGYLQIGGMQEINCDEQVSCLPWASDHPHVVEWHRPFNTIYIAAQHLSLAPELPGAGVFTFRDQLRLSIPGGHMSHWSLPTAFLPPDGQPTLSYHHHTGRWQRQGDHVQLQSVGRGQEFVIECSPDLQTWLGEVMNLRHDIA
jgi:hypothetical protein